MDQRRKWRICGLLMLLGCSVSVSADVEIQIKATIVEPTCIVSDNSGQHETMLDFGIVQMDEVRTPGNPKGKTHSLVMNVACDGAAPSGKKLKMFFTPGGVLMSWGGRSVLGTSIAGLGIDLITDSASVAMGEWITVDGVDISAVAPAKEIKIDAVLVSNTEDGLKGGSFTASASVVMEYQ